MNSPCYQCKERHYKCHGQCERYAQYRTVCDRRIEKQRRQSAINDHIDGSIRRFTKGRKGLPKK